MTAENRGIKQPEWTLEEHLKQVEEAGRRYGNADKEIREGNITDETLKELMESYQVWVKARISLR